MKINVSKTNLLGGIQIVQNIVSPHTTLPILSNILIEAKSDTLRLIATDLDIGISCVVNITSQEDGAITIPAKKFGDIIKEFPEGNITINVKKNNLVEIEGDNCVFKIMGLPKEEFPKPPEFKDREALQIEQVVFKEMLNLTSFAVSHEESRYILNGILMEIKNELIKLVSTDGRRLAVVGRKLTNPTKKEIRAIIPIKAAQELSRNLKEEGSLLIIASNNQMLFELDGVLIVSRLIEGEFPNYEQIIPKPAETKIKINREDFLSAIRRANLLSTPDFQAIKFEVFKNKIVISKSTPDVGESREEVKIEYQGKELIVGFNPHYLIDVLKNLEDPGINFELTDADKPGIIRSNGYLYLVSPMRL